MKDTKTVNRASPKHTRVWTLHGKLYDLSTFMDKHPGGYQILERAAYMEDCGVMFETYHAFSDKESIRKQLNKYLIPDSKLDLYNIKKKYREAPVYDFTEYDELIAEIKEKFPDRKSTKAPNLWYVKSICLVITFLLLFYSAMFSQFSLLIRCITAFFAGCGWFCLAFVIMHDGSHYGISTNPKLNETLEMIWNS